ncbi:hypothetical protein RMR10_004515 [Agrobacterium rosae]|uniref:hypothetical protein n=1 Tax=Agrobacterium rosae TaxID=1972867 RepID=UPI002A0D8CC5|nr:hypothetical protein [Agrobacterium rosae]MDX8315615.1 hypothetical protein [Agrobacterium rosae]
MTQWSHDISAAPLFEDFVNTRMVKNSKTGERRALPFNDTRRVDLILASKCGKVIKTYWIPDESRFAGFQPGEEIIGWMPWPKHPYEESPQQQGTDGGEIAEVKAKSRLANATGVEPSPSEHFYLEDVGSGA